jgi:hypothetical protein
VVLQYYIVRKYVRGIAGAAVLITAGALIITSTDELVLDAFAQGGDVTAGDAMLLAKALSNVVRAITLPKSHHFHSPFLYLNCQFQHIFLLLLLLLLIHIHVYNIISVITTTTTIPSTSCTHNILFMLH